MKNAVTIHDISKKAGVSISTVSRVLNKTTLVSDKLRRKVLGAVEDLDYRHNIAARTLKTKRSYSIFYMVPEYSNPYFTETYRGIQSEAAKRVYVTFLYEGTDARQVINSMIMRGVDGVIFDAIYREESKQQLIEAGIPFVQTNTPTQFGDKNSIRIDLFGATLVLIDYLRSMGHRKIGLITYKVKNFPIRERFRAFQHYAEKNGIKDYREYVSEQEFSTDKCAQGYAAVMDFLRRGVELTAIIALNDLVALGAINAATENGLKVPDDLSIVGFDNSEVGQYSNPPLTTVSIPTFKQGEIAAQMLFEIMENPTSTGYSVELHTKLVRRESVRKLPA